MEGQRVRTCTWEDEGACQIFLKNALKSTRILFHRSSSNIFLTLRGTNFLNNKRHCHIFSAQHLYHDNSNPDHFRFQHPNQYQSMNLTPECYDEHPRHFHIRVPPPSLLSHINCINQVAIKFHCKFSKNVCPRKMLFFFFASSQTKHGQIRVSQGFGKSRSSNDRSRVCTI